MTFRMLGKLTKIGTKAGLAGGVVYIYYEAGLWKTSDETIVNYDKFKKDVKLLYDAAPTDVKKWTEYSASAANSNIEPYCKSLSEFRKEWLSYDFSWLTASGDGIVKPMWNRGVCWTVETIKDSPETIKNLSSSGWQKLSDLVNDNSASVTVVKSSESGAPSMKQ